MDKNVVRQTVLQQGCDCGYGPGTVGSESFLPDPHTKICHRIRIPEPVPILFEFSFFKISGKVFNFFRKKINIKISEEI